METDWFEDLKLFMDCIGINVESASPGGNSLEDTPSQLPIEVVPFVGCEYTCSGLRR